MGDPKFARKSYDTPSHPWQGPRIKAEDESLREFGLKNKSEIWKAESMLRRFRKQSRDLQSRLRAGDQQAKIESEALINKCARMGLLPVTGGDLNEILVLKETDILNRRLQTVVYQKGLATTIKQARQFINHGHVFVDGHKVTVPGYIVLREEEGSVVYNPSSPFTDENHPMRTVGANAKERIENKLMKEEAATEEDIAAARADAQEAGITVEDGVN